MKKDSWNWNACPDLPSVMFMPDHELARAIHKGMAIDYSRQSTECAKKNNIVKFGMCSVSIRKVIFNDPATIVLWSDGTKTVVKCGPEDSFDMEKGLAMAIVKKMAGNDNRFHKVFKQYTKKKKEGTWLCWFDLGHYGWSESGCGHRNQDCTRTRPHGCRKG